MALATELQPEYVSPLGAKAMTSISEWTWRRWSYEGRISSVKAGTRLLIPVSEIRRVLAENTRPRLTPDSQEVAA